LPASGPTKGVPSAEPYPCRVDNRLSCVSFMITVKQVRHAGRTKKSPAFLPGFCKVDQKIWLGPQPFALR
ncbi:MAG: hypothetical protein R6V45_01030, partial [Oceanipulchritudo sp.]